MFSEWCPLCLCHSHSDSGLSDGERPGRLKRRHSSCKNSSWNSPQCPHTTWKLSRIKPILIQSHLQMEARMNREWTNRCPGWENGVELGIFLQASANCSFTTRSQLVVGRFRKRTSGMMKRKEMIRELNFNGSVRKTECIDISRFSFCFELCLSQR